MATIESSWHFAPPGEVPTVDAGTTFDAVFASLEARGHGAFILVEGERPTAFVRAYDLAASLVSEQGGDRAALARLGAEPIGVVVARVAKASPIVPIDTTPIDDTADEPTLQARPDTVFSVVAAGQSIGWYLNHETVRESTTRLKWFVCGYPGGGHRNGSYNGGRCTQCPFPIVSTEPRR